MFTYPVRLAHIMALFGRVAAKHTGGVDFLVFLFQDFLAATPSAAPQRIHLQRFSSAC